MSACLHCGDPNEPCDCEVRYQQEANLINASRPTEAQRKMEADRYARDMRVAEAVRERIAGGLVKRQQDWVRSLDLDAVVKGVK